MRRPVLAFLFLTGSFLPAQTRPNFTGVWVCNVAKSDYAKQAPPESCSYRLTHKEPSLTVAVRDVKAGQTTSGEVKYIIGTAGENIVMGNPLKYRASWDNQTLVIETLGRFGENEIRLLDRYTLSPDSNSLTLRRHFEGPGGPQDQTILLDRTSSPKP